MSRHGAMGWAVVVGGALLACGGGGGGGGDLGPASDVPSEASLDLMDAADAGGPGDEASASHETLTDFPPDIDWASLPRLPAGKVFTTRYAAAVASRDITPEKNIFMGGFGFCGGNAAACRESQGVHDPLFARVVVLADTETGEVVAFAGVDSVGLFLWDQRLMHEAAQLRLYEEYGVFFEGARLMVGASHSHAAPDTAGLWGPMFGVPREEAYIAMLRERTVDALVEAFGALDDVVLTWWKGSSPNGTDGSAPVVEDRDLFVVRGVRPGGEPVFTLARWSSHPTAYGHKNNGISADWVGPFRLKMEQEFGGVAVFMNGNLGGTYPDRPTECGLSEEAYPNGFKDPDLSPTDFMKVTCTGYQVADNAIAAKGGEAPVAETGIEFWHTRFGFYPDNATLLLAAKVAEVPFAWGDPEALLSENPPDMFTEFSLARVGDLTFLTTPGESFPAFGESAKAVLAEAGFSNPIILGITQDWLGYLLTEEQWKDPLLSYHQGLSPGRKVQPAFLAALRSLVGLAP